MSKATLVNQAGQKVVVDTNTPQAQQYFSQGYTLQKRALPSATNSAVTSSLGSNLGRDTANELNQSAVFGKAVTELLKSYQGINKTPFINQQFGGEQEQINRIQGSNPSLQGANPAQQAQARSASVAAVSPTIQGAQQAQSTFQGQLSTFADVLNAAKGLQAEYENSAQRARADARDLINNAIQTTGADVFLHMPQDELAKLEKTAGYGKGYLTQLSQGIKAREDALKAEQAPQTMETSGGIFQWNPKTKKWESTGLRGYHPSTGGAGGLSFLEALKNPLAAFVAGGGKRVSKSDGGFDFFDSSGKPITVQEAAAAVQASPADLLGGSTSKLDEQYINPIKLTAAQKDDVSTIDTVYQLGDEIINLGKKLNWSGVGGLYAGTTQQFLAKNFGLGSGESEQLRNFIGNVKATIAKLRGGTSFTENEEKLLETYVPTINDSPLTIQNKIITLQDYLNKKRTTLTGSGYKSNSNQNNDPLGLF